MAYKDPTDPILEKLEKKLKRLYQLAYNEAAQKIADVLSKIEFTKDMTPQERYSLALKYNRLSKLQEDLVKAYRQTSIDAIKILQGELVNVYDLNYNKTIADLRKLNLDVIDPDKLSKFSIIDKDAIKKVLTEEVKPFTKLALDNLKNADFIRSQLETQLLQGIMQGDSIPNIARRIKAVTQRNLKDAIRIARTETTRVEASARSSVGDKGKKLGFEMLKQWVATSDERTRDAHVEADGQIVAQDDYFIVGGEKLKYPGDVAGSPENVINCRCTIINIINDGSYERQADGTYLKK